VVLVTAFGVQQHDQQPVLDRTLAGHHSPRVAYLDEVNQSRHRLKPFQLKGQACPVGHEFLENLSLLLATLVLLLYTKVFLGVGPSGSKLGRVQQ
jgi:hypothetical protein